MKKDVALKLIIMIGCINLLINIYDTFVLKEKLYEKKENV